MLTVEVVSIRRLSNGGQNGGSVSDTQDIWQEAGEVYRFAIDFSVEDSARALRYPLLRLSNLLRLPEQEPKKGLRGAEELTELGQIVIQGGDVVEAADRIIERQDASPLAVTIASIVRASAFGTEDRRRRAMLGAVFGAYGALKESTQTGGDPHTKAVREQETISRAVLGAIGGAVAATTYQELQEILEARSLSWREWSEAE
jgi:hypothetical protein